MDQDPRLLAKKSTVLAVDIGGTKIQGALMGYEGSAMPTIDAMSVLPTEVSQGSTEVLDRVISVIEGLRAQTEVLGLPRPLGIGLGCSGRIDGHRGVIVWSNDTMPDWSGLPLAELITEATGVPTFVFNDVQAHGLGEARWGAARGASYALMVACGTGLGGAIIADGEIMIGSRGFAGEVGHTISPDALGITCACGKPSHIEAVAAGSGIEAAYLKAAGVRISGPEISARAAEGDEMAIEIIRRAGFALGAAIGSWASILDPELIVLGGSVTNAGPLWEVALEEGFAEQKPQGMDDLAIVKAKLGNDAPLYGAAEYALDRLFR